MRGDNNENWFVLSGKLAVKALMSVIAFVNQKQLWRVVAAGILWLMAVTGWRLGCCCDGNFRCLRVSVVFVLLRRSRNLWKGEF